MRFWAIAIGLGMSGIASCTIYALSDEVHETPCEYTLSRGRFLSDACSVLNTDDSSSADDFTKCVIWQCNDAHRCERMTTDRDRDGFPPSHCVNVAARGDCDDRNANIGPNQAEVCDGMDNDCDQRVDEGMFRVQERVALEFDGSVRELAFSRSDVSTDVRVLYRASDDAVGLGLITASRGTTTPVRVSGSPDPLRASSLNIVANVGGLLAGVVEAAATRRASVGRLIQDGDRLLFSVDPPELRNLGLRCAASEACADDQARAASDPSAPAPQIPESTRTALAVLDSQVLVGYARATQPAADGCAEPSPAPELLLNILGAENSGLPELTEAAVVLDEAREVRSPSLSAIEAQLATNALGPFGWLAGYSDISGDIVVRRVSTDAGNPLTDLRVKLKHDEAPFLEVQILRGPADENRMGIGVLARAGCGDAARVMFGLLQLTWDDTGRNELRVYRDMRAIDHPGQRPSHLEFAYNRLLEYWAVAYQTPDGLFATVLDSNGLPVSPDGYRLADTLLELADTRVFPARDSSHLFTVYSYAERPDQSPNRVLLAHDIRTCAPQAPPAPQAPAPSAPPQSGSAAP